MAVTKELVAFDFDYTLVDENSDVYVTKLAPKEIPKHIKALYKPGGWTVYMRTVFQFLYQNKIRPFDFYKCLAEISFVPGMKELLINLCTNEKFEVIIISDSNAVFIDYILKNANLSHTVNEVFTNPAYFDSNGCLQLKEYHFQDWCHISSKNLCKGSILDSYIKKRKTEDINFSRISYVGDGQNDFCPLLLLSEKDYAFPRKDFTLWKKLRENDIKASVYPWETGFDIIKILS